jgi:hypothetical protein
MIRSVGDWWNRWRRRSEAAHEDFLTRVPAARTGGDRPAPPEGTRKAVRAIVAEVHSAGPGSSVPGARMGVLVIG